MARTRRGRSKLAAATRMIEHVKCVETRAERAEMQSARQVSALAGKVAKRDTKIAYATGNGGDLALANHDTRVSQHRAHSAMIAAERAEAKAANRPARTVRLRTEPLGPQSL